MPHVKLERGRAAEGLYGALYQSHRIRGIGERRSLPRTPGT